MNKAETSPFLTELDFYTDNESISIPKFPNSRKSPSHTPKRPENDSDNPVGTDTH